MAREEATYEKVRDTYYSLVSEREKPTIRNIQNRTGGSYTTISKHLSTLKGRERRDKVNNITLSDRLKEVLADEMYAVTNQAKEALEGERLALADREQEQLTIMAELERQVEDCTERMENLQQQLEKERKHLIEVKRDRSNLAEQLSTCQVEKSQIGQTLMEKEIKISQMDLTLQQKNAGPNMSRKRRHRVILASNRSRVGTNYRSRKSTQRHS